MRCAELVAFAASTWQFAFITCARSIGDRVAEAVAVRLETKMTPATRARADTNEIAATAAPGLLLGAL